MRFSVLVDVGGWTPESRERLESVAAELRRDARVLEASLAGQPAPRTGWRRALAGFGRTRPSSAFVTVEAEAAGEAKERAALAVRSALLRSGVEARIEAAGAFDERGRPC